MDDDQRDGAPGTLSSQGELLEPERVPVTDAEAYTAELERQAREVMRSVRDSLGDLGARVREAMDRASSLWDDAHPGEAQIGAVPPAEDARARALARHWVERDFLVDPELPQFMSVLAVRSDAVWRIELRERGESRILADGREPYTGPLDTPPGPLLPVWDYDLPFAPEIESGERLERLPGTGVVGACRTCNGTGNLPCPRCYGRGFLPCPACRGRARVPCRRCRGRGRIEDPVAIRRAGAAKSYWQIQAERLAADAGDRLADLSERLRQEYGIPLPPSAEWTPALARTSETIPCPDCVNGTVPCDCGNGKRVCEACEGTSAVPCAACGGTGKVVRFKQLVRRFDTRIAQRVLPTAGADAAEWANPEVIRRFAGELVWQSGRDVLDDQRPAEVPAQIWQAVVEFARQPGELTPQPPVVTPAPDRRVIARQVRVMRVPITRVEYEFAGKRFAFVASGPTGAERFWADTFPPRWSRVGRFLKALARDLQRDELQRLSSSAARPRGVLSRLDDFRQRRQATDTSPSEDGPSDE